jgi:hypothetical protein
MQKRSCWVAFAVILSLLLAGQILTSVQAGPPVLPPPSSHSTPYIGPISVPADSVCRWEPRCYWNGWRVVCLWVWVCDYEQEAYEGDLPFGP